VPRRVSEMKGFPRFEFWFGHETSFLKLCRKQPLDVILSVTPPSEILAKLSESPKGTKVIVFVVMSRYTSHGRNFVI
jgi:hypothetical protein